jgi:glycine cleavage system H protein
MMDNQPSQTLAYKRSHFVTHLPLNFLYSPSHAWIAPREAGHWRVGLTKFATRMLGEMVDHGFELEAGAAVELGQIVGWVEGFKAISDLFCVARGTFAGSNPRLQERISLVTKDPYGAGWLYEVAGEPDPQGIEVHAYRDLLDKTIDRLLAQRKGDPIR